MLLLFAVRRPLKGPSLPENLPIRLIRARFLYHGKQKQTWLVTTLFDPKEYKKNEIIQLYCKRLEAET